MLYYDTVTVSPDVIRLMRDIAGVEHVMLGSDYGFAGPAGLLVKPVEDAKLAPSEVNQICCRNAQRIFLKES